MDESKKAWNMLEELSALVLIIRELPWDKIHSVKIDWNMIDGELVPTLEVVTRGNLP